jgi:hypothetical protein
MPLEAVELGEGLSAGRTVSHWPETDLLFTGGGQIAARAARRGRVQLSSGRRRHLPLSLPLALPIEHDLDGAHSAHVLHLDDVLTASAVRRREKVATQTEPASVVLARTDSGGHDGVGKLNLARVIGSRGMAGEDDVARVLLPRDKRVHLSVLEEEEDGRHDRRFERLKRET